MNTLTMNMRPGDRLLINHPDLPEPCQATFSGWAGGPQVLVRLSGTDRLINVPRVWITRP